MTDEQPLARRAYEQIADTFAQRAEDGPYNAHYDRPALLGLLPPVAGLRVLDAGCGPGIYAAWLVAQGGEVVGLDVSPRVVALARERLLEPRPMPAFAEREPAKYAELMRRPAFICFRARRSLGAEEPR